MATGGAAAGAVTAITPEPTSVVSQVLSFSNSRQQRKKGGWITFPFIAGGLFGMSVAQSGVTSNLIVYLIQRFHVKSIDAAQIFNMVSGCTFAAPVAGAIIADSWFGSIPVVLVTTFISLLGMIIFTLSATVGSLRPTPCSSSGSGSCEPASSAQFGVLFTAVSLMAVGAAGTRFNTATMGADQLDKPQDQGVFFNWFFCLMYGSSIIGATVIVYIMDSVGWGLGFGLCAISNVVSLISLVLGMKYYHHSKPKGSPFTGIARVVVAAIRKAKVSLRSEGVKYYYGPVERKEEAIQMPSQTLRFLNTAAIIAEDANETQHDGSVARPWRLCTVSQVEDLKDVIRIMPLWSTAIFLSISIGIQQSMAVLEALTVDRSIGPHFKVPAGSLNVASLAAVVVTLPILDRVIYPLSSRCFGRNPKPLQIVGLGHVVNAVGMGVSALVERRRLDAFQIHGLSGQGGTVPMSVAWLVLPLFLVGFGEALHFPGQVALYYGEFPEGLKTTGTAMIALIVALGFYLGTALVDLIRRTTSWLPDDINNGRMDLLFWTLAAACTFNFGLYLICAKLYTYRSNRTEAKKLDDREHDPVP